MDPYGDEYIGEDFYGNSQSDLEDPAAYHEVYLDDIPRNMEIYGESYESLIDHQSHIETSNVLENETHSEFAILATELKGTDKIIDDNPQPFVEPEGTMHMDTIISEDQTFASQQNVNESDSQRKIFERVKLGTHSIEKLEGDPKPFGFIDAVIFHSPSELGVGESKSPEVDQHFIEPAQLGGPGQLIPGTGERPPNVKPSDVLTKEETESYILNLDGMGSDDELMKQREKEANTSRLAYNTQFLKAEIGVAIALALSEIVKKKPRDPINYLGHWLFNWRYNQKAQRVELKKINDLILARERYSSTDMLEECEFPNI